MGTLLDFASAPRPTSRLKSRDEGLARARNKENGEVILFPGVRYERTSLDLSARITTIGAKADMGSTDRDR
ncbi:hypothetical protein JM93_00822 [Roseibium hamelinense]|uniref:Uncharacterized protein n=1 Tax=Roseibium hamelinense TaxID=150831 RepID=A0A562THY1_9HYPH|nr:hypothetical protein [Roseibium hamelinense]MTI42643.1 hypothetical protein [Roseibium hamelinense]TWI93267.1 hypothetical protein JM93_00822 [Roseibium hamelinense]